LLAVIAMVTTYALEKQSPWFVLAFSLSCAAASLYAVLINSLPFALAEGIWAIIAFQRWWHIGKPRSVTKAIKSQVCRH